MKKLLIILILCTGCKTMQINVVKEKPVPEAVFPNWKITDTAEVVFPELRFGGNYFLFDSRKYFGIDSCGGIVLKYFKDLDIADTTKAFYPELIY